MGGGRARAACLQKELSLPSSQILALFGKAVKKVGLHLRARER